MQKDVWHEHNKDLYGNIHRRLQPMASRDANGGKLNADEICLPANSLTSSINSHSTTAIHPLQVRLPGEVPPEFRKKLWVSLAERYLHIKKVEWDRESVRCLSEKWKSDDEELADQIIKDLHRTGSSFCSGSVNQAKLKRVLVGYARWNKEVGYCQVSTSDDT